MAKSSFYCQPLGPVNSSVSHESSVLIELHGCSSTESATRHSMQLKYPAFICLTCRKRKTGCSGERPFCQTCKQNNQRCQGYAAEAATLDPSTRSNSVSGSDHNRTKLEEDQHACPRGSPILVEPSAAQTSVVSTPSRGLASSSSGRERVDNKPSARSLDSTTLAPNTDERSANNSARLSLSTRNRMPYFRYFGPTAIVPGFNQMVVQVKDHRHSTGGLSSSDGAAMSPPISVTTPRNVVAPFSTTPSQVVSDLRTPLEIPFYDTSSMPPSELITHLCTTFFVHLGCSFPFLQRDRFLRDLEEKQVDAILVDAVCAMAARFSTHPLLKIEPSPQPGNAMILKHTTSPSDYGVSFAHRAKSALMDSFACPSVAVTQAALLLAYNEFGESRDSGLWMYLGIAIRLAQDLGMHKLEGLKFEGRSGPSPKDVSTFAPAEGDNIDDAPEDVPVNENNEADEPHIIAEQKAVERERVDTFFALFSLDRVVSSGTGRPVTLRDRDIELSFPSLDATDPATGWPMPFPALIRIIHLYGRMSDLLNGIEEVSHVTADTLQRLANLESQLTDFYQGLSPRLHFNAINFQHYVKAGQGTNFVLVHFWFHSIIVLLHQPTLLKTFEGKIQQLFSNSQQLSMSSAKTIADILAYSQLIDAKTCLGNPFTSQPMYIAACAFLKETAEHTASSNSQSRASSPLKAQACEQGPPQSTSKDCDPDRSTPRIAVSASNMGAQRITPEQKALAKHTLLATAANQHYQLCYKALQSLETYWAGTKYILTVLDQKAKGVGHPLLYTREEMESALEIPRSKVAFTSPGWRRKISWGTYLSGFGSTNVLHGNGNPHLKTEGMAHSPKIPGSPMIDPSNAIGWSLTGTMNSPSTSLAFLYPSLNNGPGASSQVYQPPDLAAATARIAAAKASAGPSQARHDTATFSQYASFSDTRRNNNAPTHSTLASYSPVNADSETTSDADLLLGLSSSFISAAQRSASMPYQSMQPQPAGQNENMIEWAPSQTEESSGYSYGDMMIESQDVDMSLFGSDMMPWLEYLPPDTFGYFDAGGNGNFAQQGVQPSARPLGEDSSYQQ
ncbi:fungal-specific transcription factor domain-containing protein [Cryomyces antarcticus]